MPDAGTGRLSITSSNSVTATINDGIFAELSNTAATDDISITANGAVSGATGGISATHTGDGAISITTAAVTGATATGIDAALE